MNSAHVTTLLGCPTRKITFGSRNDAKDYLRRLNRKGGPGNSGAQPYHCSICDAWHTGRPYRAGRNKSKRT